MSPTHFLRLPHLTRLTRTTIPSKPILLTHPSIRPITTTPSPQFPRKDSQQKDSINTEATEYSKSGTDDAAAREQSAAFDPNITNPESEKNQAGKGEKKEGYGNPLEVSPANRDVSGQTDEMGGGPERSKGDVNVSGEKGSGFGGREKKGGRGSV
ncbi:predicted protein [Sclerotinia sclerotiorum 1980 UF-70]|uniref:Uncharacterized protein n=2 Tax=Sclerotinia sclerotiorum (strain ATCC 18683 / 1980 / Ss-1) TaxID=665079 RepID=A7EVY0_SCLS1|nr:predicted protein [Sclerotinia sclerotiorum 1980 UF-70]APA15695.1 hypothetical protein sscle_15g104650 [Sclerotinia sclerotiorum 1980 UF-70]EDN93622.1 predicted protein [Sclerotinia sclerotiorum 1980 UF-70]